MLLAVFYFIIPGYLWITVSRLSERLGIIEKLSLSFLTSLCFSTLLAATLSLLTEQYLFYTKAISALASLTAIVILLFRTRPKIQSPRFVIGGDWILLLTVIGIYAIILFSVWWSSPFYPSADAIDPVIHAGVTEKILNGQGRRVLLDSNFPTGLHFAAAFTGDLLLLDALSSLRLLVALILLESLVLTYFSAHALLGNKKLAKISFFVMAFVMPVEAIHLIRVGTFANIMADMIILGMLWLTCLYVRQPDFALGITILALGLTGVFVHSSYILFLFALWTSIPILRIITGQKVRNFLKATIYGTAGLIIFAVIGWQTFAGYIQRVTGYVAGYSYPLWTLEDMIWNFLTFIGPLNSCMLVLAGFFVLLKQRKEIGRVFPVFWAVLLFIIAFFSYHDWRYVLFSLVPGVFLAGNIIESLSAKASEKIPYRRLKRVPLPLFLILLTLSGGYVCLATKIYSPYERIRQKHVLDSMQWLERNSNETTIASVGLWSDYRYLPAITGIPYAGDFIEPSEPMLMLSREHGFRYVVVATGNSNLHSFEQDLAFKEKFRNEIVVIFLIAS